MKKKLLLFMSSTIIFMLISVSVLLNFVFEGYNEANVKNYLKNNNEIMKNLIMNKHYDYSEILNENTLQDADIGIVYKNEEGKILFESNNVKKMKETGTFKDVEGKGTASSSFVIKEGNSEFKVLSVETALSDGSILTSYAKVNSVNLLNVNYLKYYLLIISIIVAFGIYISYRLAYYFTKPIRDLDFITSRIAKGELNRRVKITSNDEIGALGKSFNFMADKLQESIDDVTQKENKLRSILTSIDSGIIAIDREGKVLMINPYALNIFGLKNTIIGENIFEKYGDTEIGEIFSRDIEGYEEMKISSSPSRDFRVKTTDIINKNEYIGVVASVQDVTDIKKLENIRSRFVTNVTHELKTPLTSIKGFAETLKEVDDAETRDKFLNIINEEAERLTRLINDILTLSHIEQQKTLTCEEVDLSEIIENVCYLVKNSARDKDISVYVVGDKITSLKGNQDKLKQMLINLVDNAIKYSGNGSTVTIGTKLKKHSCVIWVEDNGIGISKDDLSKLFERFYRVDKARSRGNGGTGLGLAIVKHIVKLCHGDIKVESEVGKGSKFIVEIPLELKK